MTSVENHSTHSIVRTQNGRIFETKHLVISTAFKRKMNQLLNEFDYASAKNKTIAITAMGDSVNLMISKLIPYNNRIVLVTNGFMLLDKLVFYHDSTVTVDQFEYHNIRHLSNVLYRKTIWTGLEFVVMCQKLFKFFREHQAGLQSFRSMRRIDARRKNASALRLRFSQSLASLRQRLSQAMVRSTTQRRGSTTNPLA